MKVMYTHSEYNELVKELCLLERQLSSCIDVISNKYLYDDVNEQANATCEAKQIVDKISSYLVQMNFITCNVATSMLSKEDNDGIFERPDNINTDNDSGDTGDNLELYSSEEGDKELLEDSESTNVEEGDK